MSLLSPFVSVFSYTLQPIAPFTWFGLGISSLDVLAAFRLCLILRQIREDLYRKHVKIHGHTLVEARSFSRSLMTTLTVVFGGEAMSCPYLLVPPSFMVNGVATTLYASVQAIVDALPSVPEMSLQMELPLSFFDGFSRAYLLCNLIPPVVTANPSPVIANSPWSLLLASFVRVSGPGNHVYPSQSKDSFIGHFLQVTANGGFFLTNLFSFMNPTPLALQTPPELQAYGWTIVDLWCAPLITGLYALLTHAQPFWADTHMVLSQMMGGVQEKQVEALDTDTARALCAVILAGLFTTRTVKNFSVPSDVREAANKLKSKEAKEKTQ
ncbi:hypothetical protein K435DRAFT_858649 [Dendrothele bispora CBS 962.96]|uniref:Uncharacterized protein n=1 Tax=Dendrothele bispora (strain CBS 962.96) TaxID=1314807 RepID=A0A4S8M2K2_DENBC|nr:hypothetical protein K435DRAFT_858649 [Dendrothele bispora CBS 962.96]